MPHWPDVDRMDRVRHPAGRRALSEGEAQCDPAAAGGAQPADRGRSRRGRRAGSAPPHDARGVGGRRARLARPRRAGSGRAPARRAASGDHRAVHPEGPAQQRGPSPRFPTSVLGRICPFWGAPDHGIPATRAPKREITPQNEPGTPAPIPTQTDGRRLTARRAAPAAARPRRRASNTRAPGLDTRARALRRRRR